MAMLSSDPVMSRFFRIYRLNKKAGTWTLHRLDSQSNTCTAHVMPLLWLFYRACGGPERRSDRSSCCRPRPTLWQPSNTRIEKSVLSHSCNNNGNDQVLQAWYWKRKQIFYLNVSRERRHCTWRWKSSVLHGYSKWRLRVRCAHLGLSDYDYGVQPDTQTIMALKTYICK
jgi:hypothetical protein